MIIFKRFLALVVATVFLTVAFGLVLGCRTDWIIFSALGLILVLLLVQFLLDFKRRALEARLETAMLVGTDGSQQEVLGIEQRVSLLSDYSDWWALEFEWAQRRLIKYYARSYNCNVPSVAMHAMLREFESAKNSAMELAFGKGLDLAKWRTQNIGRWLAGYGKPLTQPEVNRILSPEAS